VASILNDEKLSLDLNTFSTTLCSSPDLVPGDRENPIDVEEVDDEEHDDDVDEEEEVDELRSLISDDNAGINNDDEVLDGVRSAIFPKKTSPYDPSPIFFLSTILVAEYFSMVVRARSGNESSITVEWRAGHATIFCLERTAFSSS